MSVSKFILDGNTKPYSKSVSQKGKHASSIESRRFVWEHVIWPLILDKNSNCFTFMEYHFKRNKVCRDKSVSPSKIAGGIVSLLNKGILFRKENLYSIYYKLIPYMRKNTRLDYGIVLKVISSKK